MSLQAAPELLPPEENPLREEPVKIKLWHLPLAMVYLGAMLGVLGVVTTVAVFFGAALTIAFFVAIAGVLLIGVPCLFLVEYWKRRADRSSVQTPWPED